MYIVDCCSSSELLQVHRHVLLVLKQSENGELHAFGDCCDERNSRILILVLLCANRAMNRCITPKTKEGGPLAPIATNMEFCAPICCLCHLQILDAAPPNIVLVFADDLGMADIGYNSGIATLGAVSTPFLDDLASAGTILGRFYANHACTPARASLMTGR